MVSIPTSRWEGSRFMTLHAIDRRGRMKRRYRDGRSLGVLAGLVVGVGAAAMMVPIASATAPTNMNSPTISGAAKVGQQLTANMGTWNGSVSSYSYQWQLCDSSGNGCGPIQDATAKAYGVGT